MSEQLDTIWLLDNVCYLRDAQAVLVEQDVKEKFNDGDLSTLYVDGYRVPEWGPGNILPQMVLKNIDKAEIVGTNANFNWKVGFGLGPKLVRLVRDERTNKVVAIA